MRIDIKIMNRFFDKVVMPKDATRCWGWKAYKDNDGYGRLNVRGIPVRVSRLSWEISRGEIPHGKVVCHRCDNPECTNPLHLYLGSHKDNMRDRNRRGRTRSGEEHGNAILSEREVLEIISLARFGVTQRAIADRYGVESSRVSKIVAGKSWRHLSR